MYHAVRDSSLAVPRTAAAAGGRIPIELAAAVRDDAAGDAAFLVQDRHALAHGAAAGIATVRVNGIDALHDLRTEGADGTNATAVTTTATSLGLRRTITVDGVTISECVVAPPDTAAILLEWTATLSRSFDVAWHIPLPVDAAADARLRWNHDELALVAVDDVSGDVRCFAFTQPVAWTVVEDANGAAALRIHATLHLEPSEPARLQVIAARSHEAVVAALDRLRNASALVRSAAATQQRRARANVAVDLPDPRVSREIEWAKQRIAAAPAGSIPHLRHALAALAAGDPATARAVMRDAPEDAALLHMHARDHAWTADTAAIMQSWPRIERAATHAIAMLDAASTHDRASAAAALDAIAITAGDIGQTAFARRITAALGPRAVPAAAAGTSDALAGDIDPGLAWASSAVEPSSETVLLSVVHGIFGVEPEAARNRLRIRPRLGDGRERTAIRNLRCGDAAVSLECRYDGVGWIFRATQDEGRVPVRLLLEPILPIRIVGDTFVDGSAASLDARRDGSGVLVPVQLVLDEERSLEVRGGA